MLNYIYAHKKTLILSLHVITLSKVHFLLHLFQQNIGTKTLLHEFLYHPGIPKLLYCAPKSYENPNIFICNHEE
jgi:hypothetical protein